MWKRPNSSCARPSALARNFHTLLAKSDPPPRRLDVALAASKSAFLPRSKSRASQGCRSPTLDRFVGAGGSFPETECVTLPSGADDGKLPRTRMISLLLSLALRQIVFFVWVSLSEQKWITFAERRGPAPNGARISY